MQFRYVRGAHARALNTRARGRMRIGMYSSFDESVEMVLDENIRKGLIR